MRAQTGAIECQRDTIYNFAQFRRGAPSALSGNVRDDRLHVARGGLDRLGVGARHGGDQRLDGAFQFIDRGTAHRNQS